MREMPATDSSFGNNMRYWVAERKGWDGQWKKNSVLQKYFQEFQDHEFTRMTPDIIHTIVDSEADTYDLEVPNGAEYTVNSMSSHNSTSCILGTASGIHPHHAKRYFRRVQVNKLEPPQKFFRKYNPAAVEESVWSANGTDDVVTFLCEVPKDALTKNDVNAIQLLKYVKLVQENWVQAGKEEKLCVEPWLEHNVSNTINVKPDEWDGVTDFIYENRQNFAGISLLPESGDKIYKQCPFTSVYDPAELVVMYGNGALFSSGLIIHALQAFNNDLFDACDAAQGQGATLDIPDFKEQNLELESQIDERKKLMYKRLFVERAKKFARRYFDGDVQKMTYCLKDVDAWKKWCDLERTYVDVPWEEFKEKKDNVKLTQTVACSGGSCELVRM
jgi:ribonucleoside-triphosphate reductase